MAESKEFLVTARKWRPKQYSDVVGQDHITKTLKNSIKDNRIHHAYLFSGPRGVGKTTTARIHAIAVNYHTDENEPDLNSPLAKQLQEGRSLDIIEIDGASNNSVDDVRRLRENAKYPPVDGKYKVYIIDEVHMLSDSAFNALLKILEEPPSHLIFIFATTEPQKIPATILSRCQRYNFRRMEIEETVEQLSKIAGSENISIDEESLQTIARKGDGSMRDSQSIFDQAIAFCGKDIKYSELADALNLIDEEFYFKISNSIINNDLKNIFQISSEVIKRGYDVKECMSGLLEHFRNLLSVATTDDTSLINTSKSFKEKYAELSKKIDKEDLLRYMELASKTENDLRFASSPRIKFESALLQMASMDKAKDIKELLNELKKVQSSDSGSSNENSEDAQEEVKKKPQQVIEDKNEEYHEEKPEKQATEDKLVINSNNYKEIWDKFLKHFANGKNNLSILNQIKEIEFENDNLTLLTNDSFIYDNLKRNEQLIRSNLNDFIENKISLNIKKKEIEYSAKTDDAEKIEKHPVEKKIMEEFNAIEEK